MLRGLTIPGKDILFREVCDQVMGVVNGKCSILNTLSKEPFASKVQ